jgi:hypothetical protein
MKFQASGVDVTGLPAGDNLTGLLPLADMPPMPGADHPAGDGPARAAFDAAQWRDLRLELDRLRAEREKLLDIQRRVMELLNSPSPDKILHDLRNVLNERELYRTLADIDSLSD